MSEKKPKHVVVDGSNIATEGRSLPSLAQLNEAVLAFMEEHPDALVTVVVDATFGHRIDASENDEFEAGISNNELVAPPAGAVGRGDAFVLGIAHKANALILSNDSFQEFHGEYSWLFDEGRLIGGKPVPHVGWVFVDRVPVRGPISRKATRGKAAAKSTRGGRSRRKRTTAKTAVEAVPSIDANGPAPVPTAPPPGRAMRAAATEPDAAADKPTEKRSAKRSASPRKSEPVNDVVPFLEFVEHHPVGSSVNGTVESYSSHGAYISVDGVDVRAYIPLRLMSDPPPRSARAALALGTEVEMFVVSFTPDRRSIDCALPDVAEAAIAAARAEAEADDSDGGEASNEVDAAPATDDDAAPAKTSGTKKSASAKKSTAKRASAKKTATKRSATKKTAAKKTGTKAAAKKSAATKAATTKNAAKASASSTPTADTTAKTAAKSTAKKATAKQATAKKTAVKKAATKKAAAKKTAAKKTAAKKTAAKKTAAKTTAKKAASKKAATRKKSATTGGAEAATNVEAD